MLLGTVGELATGLRPNPPATHSRIEKQRVARMQTTVRHPATLAVTTHQRAPPASSAVLRVCLSQRDRGLLTGGKDGLINGPSRRPPKFATMAS